MISRDRALLSLLVRLSVWVWITVDRKEGCTKHPASHDRPHECHSHVNAVGRSDHDSVTSHEVRDGSEQAGSKVLGQKPVR